jgi:pyruvate dehydrogenase (quinone)
VITISSVRRNDDIEWCTSNEEAAAFAAAAESQVTGRLAVCAGSCAPGNTHLIQGLYDAHRRGAAVMALASHVQSAQIGTSYFQEPIRSGCSPSAANSVSCSTDAASAAHSDADVPRPGGVSVLTLPGDLSAQPAANATKLSDLVTSPPAALPSPAQVQRLADMLNNADTVFAGSGVRDARHEVLTLAATLNAPIGHSVGGRNGSSTTIPTTSG